VRATAVDLMRGAGMNPTAAERAVDETTAEHEAHETERDDGPVTRP
jgi:hypothetical protein